MAVKITGAYQGNKRIELTHGPSGATLITDAPKDNHGEGASFSPTDLIATGLASCVLTVMAIAAEGRSIDMAGATVAIEKHMSSDVPRRIVRLPLTISLPATLSADERKLLEAMALRCPVKNSLPDEIDISMEFVYE